MRGWHGGLWLAAALLCFSGSPVKADETEAAQENIDIAFGVTGEINFGGSMKYSKPVAGFYDDMRCYQVLDWDTSFQLSWVTLSEDYEFSLEYRIVCDEIEERISGGTIEPLYYCDPMPVQSLEERLRENPDADREKQYPFVPEELKAQENSENIYKIEYILCIKDTNTGEETEEIFDIAYFYGKMAENPIYSDIPDGFRLVRVKEGDTLCAMAQNYLGSSYRYEEIYKANQDQLKNPSLIYKNQVLYVPME